jgi:hypothetical protein
VLKAFLGRRRGAETLSLSESPSYANASTTELGDESLLFLILERNRNGLDDLPLDFDRSDSSFPTDDFLEDGSFLEVGLPRSCSSGFSLLSPRIDVNEYLLNALVDPVVGVLDVGLAKSDPASLLTFSGGALAMRSSEWLPGDWTC